MIRIRRREITAAVAACAGLALIGTIVATSAAYSDQANAALDIAGSLDVVAVNAGIEVEGNPDAVKIVTTGAPEVGFTDPIALEFQIRNKATSSPAAIQAVLFDPDPGELVASKYPDLYEQIRFTITDQDAAGGPKVLAKSLSATEINAANGIDLGVFAPGDTHKITVSMLLEEKTRSIYNDTLTGVGVTLTGESQ